MNPKSALQRFCYVFVLLLSLGLGAAAQSLSAESGATLKIVADGDTLLEAAPVSSDDLKRLRGWLVSAKAAEVKANGTSIQCGPLELTVNAEIAGRWNSEPTALAAAFAERMRGYLAPGLSWGRTDQLVPLGESREISIKLPAGVTLAVESSNPGVVSVETVGSGRYRLAGSKAGSATLSATASNGRQLAPLPVYVKPWAARWESGPGRLEFTGPVDNKRVVTALERWLGARTLIGAQTSTKPVGAQTGDTWTFQATASAPGAITVDQTFKVEVVSKPAQAMPAADVVMLSNHPEKIFGEGILFQRKASAANYRFMWHHRNDPEGVERYLVLQLTNPNPAPRKFRMIWSSYGPSPDEIHVGHTAALTFASAGMAGSTETITLPAQGTRTIEIRRVKAGQTMSGMAYLCDESGAKLPLEVTVSAALPGGVLTTNEVTSRDPGRTASGVFPAQLITEATHTLGGPYTYLEYGGEPYVKDLDANHPSYGNFGTMYRTRLVLHNPSETPRRAYLGFSAPGGAARGVLLVDGTLYDMPMGRSGEGVPITEVTLQAGEIRQMDIELFPQAGSNYPIRLIVRSDFERREKVDVPAPAPHRSLIP